VTGPYRYQASAEQCERCAGTGAILVAVPKGIEKRTCHVCCGFGTLPVLRLPDNEVSNDSGT
jgi:hypothetical protein